MALGAKVFIFVLLLSAQCCADATLDWSEGEPLLLEEDSLRMAQAAIEMEWEQVLSSRMGEARSLLSQGQDAGEGVLTELMEGSPDSGSIEPTPGLYSANRTIFVSSTDGSYNSTSCGSLEEPCASLAQALSLGDSVVLLPGEHVMWETAAVKNRTMISIAGVMEDSESRPKIVLAEGARPCTLLRFDEVDSVTLDSISLSDWVCNDPDSCRGSALEIYSTLECSISNCDFRNNTKVFDGIEGAVRGCSLTYASVTGRRLLIENCRFWNNFIRIVNTGLTNLVGSTVTLFGAKASLSRCSFNGNRGAAENFGHRNPISLYGTVYSLGALEVSNCTFLNSCLTCSGYFCSSYGGAVYNTARYEYAYAVLSVSGSYFYYCFGTAAFPGATSGGALVTYGHQSASLSSSEFISNFVTASADTTTPLSGGAIFVDTEDAVMENCTFRGNSVEVNAGMSGNIGSGGGALFNMGSGSLSMHFCVFDANRVFGVGSSSNTGSSTFGGAVYVDGALEALNCTFSGNSASGGNADLVGGMSAGGALMQYFAFANVTVTDCFFEDNDVVGGSGTVAALAVGGGALAASGDLVALQTHFTGNKVSGGSVSFTGSRLLPSRPGGSAVGGALLVQSNADIAGCWFSENRAEAGTTTKGNCGPVAGGALASSGGWIRVNETQFRSNAGVCGTSSCKWCTGVGGAVAVANGYATMRSSQFQGNSLEGVDHGESGSVFGAAIATLLHLEEVSCVVEDTMFVGNTLAGGRSFGGAVLAVADSAFLRASFVNNVATGHQGSYGGALACRPSNVYLHACTVVENKAVTIATDTSSGGAVYAAYWDNLWTDESLFSSNSAHYGGAIFFWDCSALISWYDYTLQGIYLDNSALTLGGVAYFHHLDFVTGSLACILEGYGNSAPCGSECAGSVFEGIQLGSFMVNVWPGQAQNLAFGLIDAFGQVCPRVYYSVRLPIH